jgi:acetylornithine deacetylase/succinyl-diaminopimelate desuccinylase
LIDLLNCLKEKVSSREISDLAGNLIKIPSYTGLENQEKEIAEFICSFFRSEGINAEMKEVLKGRPNVYATLKGQGSGPSLMLTGHTDTVPPYEMKIPPFSGEIRGGRVYGRGAVDMKGPLASMIMAVIGLQRCGIRLKGDLIFAGVINEEEKSEGTEEIVYNGPHTDAAIVGEPTNLQIAAGHRGLEWLEVIIKGRATHGGRPEKGVNAISKAAKFITEVENSLMPKLLQRKHPLIGNPILNFGVIKGGDQPSTVAGKCSIMIDRRWTPNETLEQVFKDFQDLIERLHNEDPDFSAEIIRMENNMATLDHYPMEIDLEHPLIKVLSEAADEVLGHKAEITSFPAWTDASLLSNYAKIPCVVFGPGDLAQAHSAVEYIEIDQLYSGYLVYALAAYIFCSEI